MGTLHAIRGGATALPLDALLATIPSLPRPVLARLVTRMIDRMDELDPDPDAEAGGWNERRNQAKWPRDRSLLNVTDAEEDDGDSCVTDSPHDKTDEGNTEHDYRNAPAVGATSTSEYCAEFADPVITSGPVSNGGALFAPPFTIATGGRINVALRSRRGMGRHVLILLAIASLGAASPAAGAPTYLVCTFEKGPTALYVTADEPNGVVTTLVESTGHMEKRPAVFSPSAVKWSSPGSLGISYRLSRVDLSLERVLVIGDKSFPDTATCKIQETPKRAF